MFWYLFIGYIIFAELVVVATLVLALRSESCPAAERLSQLDPNSTSTGLVIAAAIWLIFAPIIAPLVIVFFIKLLREPDAELEFWKGVRASHYDLVLDPVHAGNITDEMTEHFQQHSPILDSLGCESLGVFWIKHEPFNSKAKLYLDPQGNWIAEIGISLETFYCEILSFLEDGSIISTCSCDPFDAKKFSTKRFYVQFCPGQEMSEMVDAHQSFLQQTANDNGMNVRAINNKNWDQHLRYQNRRFSQIKFELGECETSVKCEFPTAASNTDSNTPQPATPVVNGCLD